MDIHNHIHISNDLNVLYTVHVSFCTTYHYHRHCYQRAKIKGWFALSPLPDLIEKHNFDKPCWPELGYLHTAVGWACFQGSRPPGWNFRDSRSPCSLSFPQVRPSQGHKSMARWGQLLNHLLLTAFLLQGEGRIKQIPWLSIHPDVSVFHKTPPSPNLLPSRACVSTPWCGVKKRS